MTPKHTPGPWKTGHILNGDLWVGPDYDQPLVCRIHDERDEWRANAALISAAPDLLEALKLADAMLSGANMNANVVERKVRAAITKAEGSDR